MATNLAASLRSVMGISTTAISASIRIRALYGTPMLADSLLWGFPAWDIPSFHIDIPDSNWLESSSSLMPIAPTSQGGFHLSVFFRNALDPLNRIGRRSCPSDGFQLVEYVESRRAPTRALAELRLWLALCSKPMSPTWAAVSSCFKTLGAVSKYRPMIIAGKSGLPFFWSARSASRTLSSTGSSGTSSLHVPLMQVLILAGRDGHLGRRVHPERNDCSGLSGWSRWRVVNRRPWRLRPRDRDWRWWVCHRRWAVRGRAGGRGGFPGGGGGLLPWDFFLGPFPRGWPGGVPPP